MLLNKKISNVKRCTVGRHTKECRNDIKVKVNMPSSVPASLHLSTLEYNCSVEGCTVTLEQENKKCKRLGAFSAFVAVIFKYCIYFASAPSLHIESLPTWIEFVSTCCQHA